MMETRKVGALQVSLVGLGCNNFGAVCDEKQTAEIVNHALDSGVNFFDTADVYSKTLSEEFLGKALRNRRDEAFIATKFGSVLQRESNGETKQISNSGGASAKWIAQAIDDSLKRLGTDRVDLYQLHLPTGDVPIEETLEALDLLVRDGKVREIGCSNFSGEMIDSSIEASESDGLVKWASVQNHYNLLAREVEEDVIPACISNGLVMLPYFPLANGFLTGKYRRGENPPAASRLGRAPVRRGDHYLNDRMFTMIEKLESFAAERGHTLLELAISWLACRPAVASVIAGATKPEQVRANSAAASWKLDDDDMNAVDAITRNAGA